MRAYTHRGEAHRRVSTFWLGGGQWGLSQICLVLRMGFKPLVMESIGSRGRRSTNWATTSPWFNLIVSSIFVSPHHRLRGLRFTTDGYRIFNVRTNRGACRTHEGGSGTNKSAQELTRRDRKTVPHSASPGDRTRGSGKVSKLFSGLEPVHYDKRCGHQMKNRGWSFDPQ